jgi:hypothetical protein
MAGLGGLAIAQAARFGPSLLPEPALRPLLWALAGLFAVSFVGNLASASRVERLHGAPLALLLAASTGIVAVNGPV